MKGRITMINKALTMITAASLEERLRKAIGEFVIDDLMEYTADSCIGCDLSDFYQTVVKEVLTQKPYVEVEEISDGKYNVTFEFDDDNRYQITSNAWDTVDVIVENIVENVITPYSKGEVR